VTASKLKEQQMAQLTALVAEQNQRFAAILANVPGAIWEAKGSPANEQTLIFISPYIEKMLGYTHIDFMNDPSIWQQIIHPEDRQQAITAAEDIYANKDGGMVQYRWVGKQGQVLDIESYTSIVRDKAHESAAVYGVTMDITARKQVEDELSRYAQELKRSNEELQQFAYVASHDLQEPLRMVTSYLQLIEQRYVNKLDQDAKDFIGYAVDGAKRMKRLINDLLTFSHVETRGREFTKVNGENALKQALKNLEMSIVDSKAIITHDPLPTIVADEQQIVQLLQNLLGNALKFRGSHVPEIHIGVKDQHDKWEFYVRDNGIGIESDSLERIFVIFQRLHNREEYEGTGIGLAICKKIVERHSGHIWVESQLGQGSSFYFTIPKRKGRNLK
jgi:PAS domain S-box-containing protein